MVFAINGGNHDKCRNANSLSFLFTITATIFRSRSLTKPLNTAAIMPGPPPVLGANPACSMALPISAPNTFSLSPLLFPPNTVIATGTRRRSLRTSSNCSPNPFINGIRSSELSGRSLFTGELEETVIGNTKVTVVLICGFASPNTRSFSK